jgi:hypothetical protein
MSRSIFCPECNETGNPVNRRDFVRVWVNVADDSSLKLNAKG